jgi:gustatory receptor
MDYKKPFNVGFFILRIFGLWFPDWSEPHAVFYFAYSVVFQGFFTVLYMLPMWIEIFLTVDINQLTRLCVLGLTEVGCFAKIVNLYVNFRTIKKSCEEMEATCYEPQSEEEEKICQRKLKFFEKVQKRFLTLCFSSFFSSMFVPLLEAQKILPYYSWWFTIDWTQSDTLYNLFYIYQCLGMSMHTLVNTAFDLLFPFFMHFIVIQLEMLYERLNSALKCDRKKFLEAIEQHNRIVEYSRTIEKTFSTAMFVQFSLSGIVICVTAYQLTMVSLTQLFIDIPIE